MNKIMKNRIKSVHRGHNFVMLLIAKEQRQVYLGYELDVELYFQNEADSIMIN